MRQRRGQDHRVLNGGHQPAARCGPSSISPASLRNCRAPRPRNNILNVAGQPGRDAVVREARRAGLSALRLSTLGHAENSALSKRIFFMR